MIMFVLFHRQYLICTLLSLPCSLQSDLEIKPEAGIEGQPTKTQTHKGLITLVN